MKNIHWPSFHANHVVEGSSLEPTLTYISSGPTQRLPYDVHWGSVRSVCPLIFVHTELQDIIRTHYFNFTYLYADDITVCYLYGGDAMIQILTDLFNTCLHHQLVPKAWKNALVVLIHKKGNTSDIKNYRPISLLPIMYKVFSNILLQRMIRTLDFHQPREQAGFRAGYSTIDHLQVVNQLQEKANEYNMPLCFCLRRLWKGLWQHRIWTTLWRVKEPGSDEAYVNILRNLYSEATSVLRLHKDSEKFNLEEEPDKETTSLPNCLRHVCNTPSSTRSTGKQKVSGLTVNTYPT